MTGPDSLRFARETDHGAIDALLRAAFGGPREAGIMGALRAAGVVEYEMVMPWQDGIVGHLAVSRLVSPNGWLVLAPVAVAPGWQRKGLGVRLVAGVLQLCAIKGQTVAVLGEPAFYARAGFSAERAAGLTATHGPQPILLAGPGTDVPVATLMFPAAFDAA